MRFIIIATLLLASCAHSRAPQPSYDCQEYQILRQRLHDQSLLIAMEEICGKITNEESSLLRRMMVETEGLLVIPQGCNK